MSEHTWLLGKPARFPRLRKAWLRLHEPRSISAIYGAWWAAMLALGGYSVFMPPRTVEAVAGNVLMMIIAAVLTLGGALGVGAVIRGAYWVERSAVIFGGLGFFGYLVMVGYLWVFTGGSRGMQMLAILGAIGFTALRTYWVKVRPYSLERGTELSLAHDNNDH